MLLRDAPLTLRELMSREEAPLASIFREVLGYLKARSDTVLFGAQAVNAYCADERLTGDIDVLSTRARIVAGEIRALLHDRLRIAARVRKVASEKGYRVYQLRRPKSRNLVDIRHVETVPASREIDGVRVLEPVALIAMKVISLSRRADRPKGATDLADLRRLLLAFPDLKAERGVVSAKLEEMNTPPAAIARWQEIARAPIEPDVEDF